MRQNTALVKADASPVRATPTFKPNTDHVLRLDKPAKNSGRAWDPSIPAAVLFDPRLNAPQIRLIMVISYYTRTNGECWPSNQTLADKCQCRIRSLRENLSVLKRLGLIAVRKERERDRGEVLIPTWTLNPSEGEAEKCRGGGEILPGGEAEICQKGRQKNASKESALGIIPIEQSNVTLPNKRDDDVSTEGTKTNREIKPRSLSEALAVLTDPDPQVRTEAVAQTAQGTAEVVGDLDSVSGFRAKAKEVADGTSPIGRYKKALDAGIAAHKSGKNNGNGGRSFMTVWNKWVPVRSEAEVHAEKAAGEQEAQRAEYNAMCRQQIEWMRGYVPEGLVNHAAEFNLNCELDTAGTLQITTYSGNPPGPMQQEVIAILQGKEAGIVEVLKAREEKFSNLKADVERRAARFRHTAPAGQGVRL